MDSGKVYQYASSTDMHAGLSTTNDLTEDEFQTKNSSMHKK